MNEGTEDRSFVVRSLPFPLEDFQSGLFEEGIDGNGDKSGSDLPARSDLPSGCHIFGGRASLSELCRNQPGRAGRSRNIIVYFESNHESDFEIFFQKWSCRHQNPYQGI